MGGGAAAYRRVEVETASPTRLVVMLYNGAIRRIEDGKRAITAGDIQKTHEHLIAAQEIVSELRGALDLSAGDVAEDLNRVYEYLHHLLVQANLRKNAAHLDECLDHLRGLRDAWERVCAQPALPTSRPAPAHNPLGHTSVNVEG